MRYTRHSNSQLVKCFPMKLGVITIIPILEVDKPSFIFRMIECSSSISFLSYQILDIPPLSKHSIRGSTTFSLSSLA